MADKDRIFHLYSDESIGGTTKYSDQENRGVESKTNAVQRNKERQQGQTMNVFERNYEYARIYENKRCALKAEKDAYAMNQRHFKASPMPIVQPQQVIRHEVPKFTVPETPQVLKHSKRTPRK
ncbi:uncharacterized protein LOC125761825 [Anopheles funestus]|uniref:Uncharacterized protein n=1 Tax=Anopheles funestus TaxID=62324 RepID=A0A182RU69_ANOFN|nr:uncharacterized protein LOC125761825 [Anopheles funestus]